MNTIKLTGNASDSSEWARLSDDEKRAAIELPFRSIPRVGSEALIVPAVPLEQVEQTRNALANLGVMVDAPGATDGLPDGPIRQWQNRFLD